VQNRKWSYKTKNRRSVDLIRLQVASSRSNSLNGDLQAAILARGLSRQNGRSSLLGLGFFRTACVPHRFLTTTTSFDDGPGITTVGRKRWCPRDSECGHRRSQPCEGCLWHSSSSSRFRCCQHPLDYDQGKFPPVLRRWAFDSHLSRIPWPTNRIMSNLG
jgi:hypothetical protein